MIRLASVLAALMLASCASTPAPSDGIRCDMTVAFGSYASGIDTVLYERINRALTGDSRVAQSLERGWGREGERTLCIRTRNRGDIDALFGELQAMVAQAGGLRGPTSVALGNANWDGRPQGAT